MSEFQLTIQKLGQKAPFHPWTSNTTCTFGAYVRSEAQQEESENDAHLPAQNKETPGQHAAAAIAWNFTAKSRAPLWLEGKPSERIIRKDGGSTPTAAPTGCRYKEHRCLNRAPSESWLSHVCHLFIYVKGLTVLHSTIMFMFRCITQKKT